MAEPREFYDENEDQPQVIVQKKGGFLGKFIALLLGLILGIASAFGGVAAIAYFVPIKDGINTVGNLTNTDINYKDFITEEYGDKSIVEAITSLSKLAQKGDGLTFNDLNSVSPQVEKAIENLVESAGKNSIKLDKTELMSTPLKDFPDLLIEEIEDIELGEILMKVDKGIYSSEAGPILKELFFGQENVNYKDNGDGTLSMLPLTYTFENNTFACVDGTEYTFTTTDLWTTKSGEYIKPYTGEGSYLYAVYEKDDTLLYALGANTAARSSSAVYTAYAFDNNTQAWETALQASLKLGAFMDKDANPIEVIGNVRLGTLLGITTEEEAKDDKNSLLVTLAYGTFGVDYEFVDGKIMPVNGKEFITLTSLITDSEEVLDTIELGALLNIKTKADAEKSENKMLVALAYGTYGRDFVYSGTADDSAIVPPDGKERAFTTIGDLIGEPEAVLDTIELGALLGVNTKEAVENPDNSMLVALAYGTQDVDFEIINGYVSPIGDKEFLTLGSLISNPDDALNTVQLGALLGIKTKGDVDKNSTMAALAYGKYGVDYEYEPVADFNKDGKIDKDDEPFRKIKAIETGTPFLTLGKLITESGDVLENIELGALLGITTKEDVTGNEMLVAIAYGTEGEDYTFDANGKIIPVGERNFTTVGQLMTNSDDVLNSLQLGTLLGINTEEAAKKDSNAMYVALAYGKYGTDYDFVDGYVHQIETGRKFTTLGDLMKDPQNTFNEIELGVLLGVNKRKEAENSKFAMYVALAYGTYGIDYEFDGDGDDAQVIPIGDKKFVTVGDLIKNPENTINDMELGVLLGVNKKDVATKDGNEMFTALCYGTVDLDYYFNDDGYIVSYYDETTNPNVKKPTTIKDLIEKPQDALNDIQLGSLLQITTKGDTANNDMIVALAYGEYGKDYTFAAAVDADNDGTISNEEEAARKIIPAGLPESKPFTTLGDLISNPNDTLQSIQLGSILGIKTRAQVENADPVIVSLAFGSENVDYIFTAGDDGVLNTDDDLISELREGAFTTLAQLMDEQKASELFTQIELSAVFMANVLDPETDHLSSALAFGHDGEHYYLKRNADGTLYTEEIELEDGSKAQRYAFAEDGTYTLENGTVITVKNGWIVKDAATGETYAPRTVADLRGGDISTIIDGLLVSDVFNTDQANAPQLLKKIGDWKISDLANEEKFKTLQVKDLLTISDTDNGILSEIGEWTISDLETSSKFDSITLKSVLDPDGTAEGVVKVLANKFDYKKDDNGEFVLDENNEKIKIYWTLGDLKTDDSLINSLTVGELLGITATEGILSKIKDWTLNDLKDESTFDELQLKDVIDVGTSGMLSEMGEWKIGEIDEAKIKTLTLKNVLNVQDGETGLLATLANKTKTVDGVEQPWTIADLTQDNIKTLKIKELINITDTKGILYEMGEWTLDELNQDKIKTLKLKDIIDVGTSGMLYEMGNWTLNEINEDKIKTLTLKNVLNVQDGETGLLYTLANKQKTVTENGVTYYLYKNAEGNEVKVQAGDDTTDLTPITWTIADLTNENIKSLTLGEVVPDATAGDPSTNLLAALKDTKISELDANYVKDNLKVGQALGVTSTDTGMLAKFADYKISEFTEEKLKSELKLKDVVTVDHPVMKALSEYTLKELSENNTTILNNITIGTAIGLTKNDAGVWVDEAGTPADAILAAMAAISLGELDNDGTIKNTINGLKIGDVISVDPYEKNSSGEYILDSEGKKVVKKGVLEYLVSKEYTIAQLSDQNTINNIPLAQIIDIDSDDAVLSALKKNNATLSNLPEIIKNLSLIEILGEENMKDNFFLQHVMGDDVTISNIGTKIDTITIVDLFKNSIEYKKDASNNVIYETVTDKNGNVVYQEDGVTPLQKPVLTGTWKYLLTWNVNEDAADPAKEPNATFKQYYEYTAKDMEALMANMTQNIEDATLRNLYEDDIAPHLAPATLDAEVMCSIEIRVSNGMFNFNESIPLTVDGLGIPKHDYNGDGTYTYDENSDGIVDITDANGQLKNLTLGDLSVPQLSAYLYIMINALESLSNLG